MNKLMLYFNTLKYLKVTQFYFRVFYKLIPARFLVPKNIGSVNTRPNFKRMEKGCAKESYATEQYLYVLGKQVAYPQRKWELPDISKLENYNINYFDFLGSDKTNSSLAIPLIESWIEQNNDHNSIPWHAYPVSLRIVNWVKYCSYHNLNSKVINQSLLFQSLWLINNLEYQLLGNHLFVNAKALLFAGFYLDGKDADKVRQKGVELFKRELKEQLLPDGASFELSPMYHAIMLEDILDLKNLVEAFPTVKEYEDLKTLLDNAISKMFPWLKQMTLPSGRVAHFNDSSGGVAPLYEELAHYAMRVGVANSVLDNERATVFYAESGYGCMSKGDAYLICDVGNVGPDYIPGHAHADTLSFEMSLSGCDLFVNSGVSEYGLSQERLRQRSTKAHNTLEVNGENSSEVWSGFRVARRARVSNVMFQPELLTLSAEHNGYKRLGFGCIHSRKWTLSADHLEIDDVIAGQGEASLKFFFHLHPDVKPKIIAPARVLLAHHSLDDVFLDFSQNLDVNIVETSYHPEFGKTVKNFVIVFSCMKVLPHTEKFRISWKLNESS